MRTKKVFGRTGARSRLFEQLSGYRMDEVLLLKTRSQRERERGNRSVM